MAFQDQMGIQGRIHLRLSTRDGQVVEERAVHNLVTLEGRALMGRCFAGLATLGGRVELAVGTGAAPPSLDDQALSAEIDRAPAGSPDLYVLGETGGRRSVVRVRATFPARAGAPQPLCEAGVWLEQVGGAPVLFNRAVFPVVHRTEQLEMSLAWEILF